MNEKEKEQLIKVIKNNAIWPLMIEGLNSAFFKNAAIIDCQKGANQLAIKITEKGYQKPEFLEKLEASKNGRSFLVLENLEKLDHENQYTFAGFLKHRGVSGYKLPANTQIIITTSSADKLSEDIKALCIIYKI